MPESCLTEVILSSTSAASPLPTTQLHALVTGSLLFTLKTSVASSPSNAEIEKVGDQSLRKTMGYVESGNGCGGMVMGLVGKEGKAGMNVWSFQKEQVVQKLIPPIRMTTISLSSTGAYLAGGTSDGRIFLWEVSTGILITAMDAHYRAVSVLAFTNDDAALISGAEDAGICVWSLPQIFASTAMDPISPYATLTDHTLGISAICVGAGSFPNIRLLSASMDSRVKLWDLSISASSKVSPALLSTFDFPSPVYHLAWDNLERFFFASCAPETSTEKSNGVESHFKQSQYSVRRVSFYKSVVDDIGFQHTAAVGGGGQGDSTSTSDELKSYQISECITALHLSSYSATLLVGTSDSSIHILALPALLPLRIISPPLSSTPLGAITFLSTMIRPPDLGAGSGDAGMGSLLPLRAVMPEGMARSTKDLNWNKGGKKGRIVNLRITQGDDLSQSVLPIGWSVVSAEHSANAISGMVEANGSRNGASVADGVESLDTQLTALKEENATLKKQLSTALNINDTMWKQIVDAGGRV